MKFDEKYPDAQDGFEPPDEHGMTFLIKGPQPCWNCKDITNWWDIDFGAPICSEECQQKKWSEFKTAYNLL